tara:strand:- start:606 stop:1184 length:579 start_codon:yes stop_codon:yes gene_type:complete
MILKLVENDIQKAMVKRIIVKHHSYVPTHRSVGRRIDWLVYENDDFGSKPVGMIGIGSSVYPPPKDLLRYVGMTKSEYKDNFNSFANNWRYCMTKSIPNAGSQILKQLRYLAPIEWEKKYKNFLSHLITFVGGDNNGAVYKSDNWEMVGETAGLPDHKSLSMKWDNKSQLKTKFVKPTGENKKLIFVTEIKR